MLKISDAAIKKFKKILADSNAEDHGIRIFRSGGG